MVKKRNRSFAFFKCGHFNLAFDDGKNSHFCKFGKEKIPETLLFE